MKRVIVFLSFYFIILFVNGRQYKDSLYLHLYNFQIMTGELKAGLDVRRLRKSFCIKELVDSLNTDTFSIYRFYHLEYSDPVNSFLIIEKNNIEIYDILSYDVLIEKILDVSVLNEKSKVLLIKKILNQLRTFYGEVDVGRLIMERKFGKYHYYMPVKNWKNINGIIQSEKRK